MNLNKMSKPAPLHIVLDLDNTLIYSIPYRKSYPEWIKKFHTHKMMSAGAAHEDFLVLERPFLRLFLKWLFTHFNVSVWSAGTPDYVDYIVKHIITPPGSGRKLHKVFTSNDCDKSVNDFGGVSLKRLDMLYKTYPKLYSKNNTIIVDDLKCVVTDQPENAIRIIKFLDKEKFVEDTKLLELIEKLKCLVKSPEIGNEPVQVLLAKSKKSPKKGSQPRKSV